MGKLQERMVNKHYETEQLTVFKPVQKKPKVLYAAIFTLIVINLITILYFNH